MSGSHGPAVKDGVPQYTSVSALNTFVECNRKWFLKYVEHKPDKPQSAAQQRGTEGHKRLEHYLRTGQDVLDPLEKKAIEWLPKPGIDLYLEHPIHEGTAKLSFDGIPIVGYIDLLDPRDPLRVKIVDFKFNSNVEKYGATASEIKSIHNAKGRQVLTYGAWARLAFPRAQEGVVSLAQFQTKGRAYFEPVSAKIDLDATFSLWSDWARGEGPKLKEVAKERSYLRVLPNYSACSAYGGCAYQSICHDTGSRPAEGLFPRGRNDQVEAPKGQETSETKEIEMGLIKKEAPAAATATPAFTAPSAPPAPPEGILPPDAPKSKPELASKPPEVVAVEGPPAAKKRKAKVETDVVHPSPQNPAPAGQASSVDGTGLKAASPGHSAGIFLYFGCSPLGIATKTLHEF